MQYSTLPDVKEPPCPNSKSNEAKKNHLLAILPADVIVRLLPQLEEVFLKRGRVLYDCGEKMSYIYFPTTAIIALLYIMEDGSTAEIGIMGNDGVVGVALFLGGETTTNVAQVQVAGSAFRLRAEILHNEFTSGGVFQTVLLRYTQALITQISQNAACNRLHFIEQQLCRWLLINRDLLQSNKLTITHELIANMLGVRRAGISEAAGRLKEQGLISYERGAITMVDRAGLEGIVCECFQVVKDEYARLFGNICVKNQVLKCKVKESPNRRDVGTQLISGR